MPTPTPKVWGAPKQRSRELQEAQALMIVERKLKGIPLDLIAKEFNLSEDSVKRRLRLAKRMDIIEDIKERIIGELLGPAVNALKSALDEGNVDAAKAVLFGTGVLLKNPVPQQSTGEMTLTEYRQRKAAQPLAQELRDRLEPITLTPLDSPEPINNEDPLQHGDIPPLLPSDDDGGREGEGDD